MARIAGARRGQGWTHEQILENLRRFNLAHCKPPECDSAVKAIAKWVMTKPRRRDGRVPIDASNTEDRTNLNLVWDILSRASLKDRNGSRRSIISALIVEGYRANTMKPEVSMRRLALASGLSLRTVFRCLNLLHPFVSIIDSDSTQGDDFSTSSTQWRICQPAKLLEHLSEKGISIQGDRIDNVGVELAELALGTTVTTYDYLPPTGAPCGPRRGGAPANKSKHPLAIGGAQWRYGALGKLGRRVYIALIHGGDEVGARRMAKRVGISVRGTAKILHGLHRRRVIRRLSRLSERANPEVLRRVAGRALWWIAEAIREVTRIAVLSRWDRIEQRQIGQFECDREAYQEWRYKRWLTRSRLQRVRNVRANWRAW